MNKKVLVFSYAYYPHVGGAEVAIKEITDRLGDIQFDLVTYNLGRNMQEERIGNVNIYRVGALTKYLYPIKSFIKGLLLHQKKRYDTVWAVMANTGFAALFLKLLFPRIKFVLTIQEGDPISQIKRRVWFVYPLFRLIFRKADYVTVISNYLADFARSMGAKEVEVIPNGVDLGKFKASLRGAMRRSNLSSNEQRLLRSARNDSGNMVLVTTGRLVKKNAVDDIIKALKFLPGNVTLRSIGSGEDEDYLRRLTQETGVETRVEFFPHTEHAAMIDILRSSDIFVRPSLSEGLGNSFLEAMALGLPVIGTEVGGIPDFLKDGETGLFCEVREPEDIARKVMRLVQDGELYDKISRNARSTIEKKYDWDQIANKFQLVF